jgi:hypothetical protein
MHDSPASTRSPPPSTRTPIFTAPAGAQWPEHVDERPPPVHWREFIVVVILVALSDVTIYRAAGFAGFAALFLLAPALFVVGAFQPRFATATRVVGLMLVLLAARIVWCGSPLSLAVGIGLLASFATALSGRTPYVAATAIFALSAIAAGCRRLVDYGRCTRVSRLGRITWLNVAMPLAALILFGTVFVYANPDLLDSVWEAVHEVVEKLLEWLRKIAFGEIVFWIAAAVVSAGLLGHSAGAVYADPVDSESSAAMPVRLSKLYSALRNTLVAVIVLFAVYLAFEFRTLWFREFPKGFYYSGYAHEGAAWLTFALALATLVLSLAFRGGVLTDPRLPQLRRLGWIWSAENFILAVAVYHRMAIYIRFNGMSPMRIVGLYGISAVVVGFTLVVWKIGRERGFGWLVQRQLWTLAVAVWLYVLTPVDAIVVAYNVRRILAGDPAPSVQISVHSIGAEGLPLLLPLLECDDEFIREGVRAMLAERDDDVEEAAAQRASLGWTSYQVSDAVVVERLRAERQRWAEYRDRTSRAAALRRFHQYAYQWY